MGIRFKIFRIGISVAFFFLFSRLVWLQLFKGNFYQAQAEMNRIRSLTIEAPRGGIFDRNGKPLVHNKVSFTLAVIPDEVLNHLESLRVLSDILHLDRKEILTKLIKASHELEAVKLKDHLSFAEFAEISEYLPEPGIYLIEAPTREYLYPLRDAHLLGYVGEISGEDLKERGPEGLKAGDIVGQDGIEKEYDRLLRGKNGAEQSEVDASGRFIRVLETVSPVPGNDLVLTLDETLQEAAWKAMKEELALLRNQNGIMTPASVVALNPNNGEVLAYVAWPSFNPNLFSNGITQKEYEAILNSRFNPLLNRPIQAAYPTGSTFKIVTGSAGLQEKVISPDKPLYCPGYYSIPGITFHCFVRRGHGWIKFVEAVAQSCDVYFYKVGHRLGIDRLDRYAGMFGIGKKTGIDLPGESAGLLPTPEWKKKVYGYDWYPAETINMAIGQGYLQVTPVQLAAACSVIANGGTYFRPHLFLRAATPKGLPLEEHLPQYPVAVSKLSVSPEVFALMREGMKGAVDHGTATAAKLPGVAVAGKTGTAENLPTPLNPAGRNHAWFESFAPYEKPEIVVVVMMEQSGGYGGGHAAPVAKKIFEAYFNEKKFNGKVHG